MRRLLSIALSVFLAAPAFAGAKSTTAPTLPLPSANWSGFYVGATGGGGALQTAWSNATYGTYSGDDTGGGAIFGGRAGWSFQTSDFVFGIEGDMSGTDLEVYPITNCDRDCSTSVNWLGTLRGRIGYAFGKSFLAYLTGGAAFGGLEHVVVTTPNSDVKNTEVGYVLGGGIEDMITPRWSVGVDYEHVAFDRQLVCPAGPCTYDNYANYVSADIVRGAINYHFGAPTAGQ